MVDSLGSCMKIFNHLREITLQANSIYQQMLTCSLSLSCEFLSPQRFLSNGLNLCLIHPFLVFQYTLRHEQMAFVGMCVCQDYVCTVVDVCEYLHIQATVCICCTSYSALSSSHFCFAQHVWLRSGNKTHNRRTDTVSHTPCFAALAFSSLPLPQTEFDEIKYEFQQRTVSL